jgi:crotonobetaine/carnitine-CoA ligase
MQAVRTLDLAPEDMTFGRLLERQARRNGDKPYLCFEERVCTYAEVDSLTNRLANGLLDAGVAQGDHVAILTENTPETLWVNFALGKIGAVACPVNTAAKGALLTYYLNDSASVALVVGRSCLGRYTEVAASAPAIRRVVVLDDLPVGAPAQAAAPPAAIPLEALLAAHDRPPAVDVGPHDPQVILYTSGTTGPSKGVIVSNLQSLEFSRGRVEYLGLWPQDVVYTCLPLFHGNALSAASIPALMADATLVLSRRFSASGFWPEVRRYGVTQFNLLSSMTNILWGQPASELDRAHRVRQCTMVPVPSFAPDFEARFGIEVVSSYSLTDFGQGSFLQAGYPRDKMRSAGKPRPGVALAILDDDDRPVPAGEPGEICLKATDPRFGGRHYFRMPEEDARANRDGWFHTGDRGYLDADGYLYFVDRKKDAIRRRGENISSWEVEQGLMRHPAVAEAAVYPVRSEMSEDEVAASVVCRAGMAVDPVELVRFCERNMAYFMVPRYVEFVADLPRTLTEKVQKQALRESAERRLGELWDREKAGIVLSR